MFKKERKKSKKELDMAELYLRKAKEKDTVILRLKRLLQEKIDELNNLNGNGLNGKARFVEVEIEEDD